MTYEVVKLETGDVVEVALDVPAIVLQAARAAIHNTTGRSRLNDGLIVAKVLVRVTDDWRTRREKRRQRERGLI